MVKKITTFARKSRLNINMLFNSLNFAIFLPIVFVLYWFLSCKNFKTQNLYLLCASYVFYAFWNWSFLFLLTFSTFLDYSSGIQISRSKKTSIKRLWLTASIVINLGLLGYFKYCNFFIDSFATFLQHIGLKANIPSLSIILPVGISFYTFHGLSYVLDIYNNTIEPRTNYIDYSLFVSFFPLLVAGPIERATHLLPQIERQRTFDYHKITDGLRQILWGLFKKIVIADNCAEYANQVFNNPGVHNSSALVIGAVLFAFQIYGDFSGYSDIALGTARLFGFELLRNFANPYFSRDIAEFWRRWHISLSSWFRDYLYIPLGGSRSSTIRTVRNTFIIFIVSGFWHGANWTFLAWGTLHALYFLPLLLAKKNRANLAIVAETSSLPSARELAGMSFTFLLVVFAWIFFRCSTISQSISYIAGIFNLSIFSAPTVSIPYYVYVLILVFLFIEWIGRCEQYAIAHFPVSYSRPMRWSLYYALVFLIFFCTGTQQQFIYFQF